MKLRDSMYSCWTQVGLRISMTLLVILSIVPTNDLYVFFKEIWIWKWIWSYRRYEKHATFRWSRGQSYVFLVPSLEGWDTTLSRGNRWQLYVIMGIRGLLLVKISMTHGYPKWHFSIFSINYRGSRKIGIWFEKKPILRLNGHYLNLCSHWALHASGPW